LSNLTFACVGHHLAGEHGGRVMVWGRAPHDIYFQVGSPTAFGGGYPIWKNDRLVREFASVREAREWAWRQKRALEK